MATVNAQERAQYRSKNARLGGVARAALELLNRYSWEDGDGQIHFTNEPNIAGISNPMQSALEVQVRWSELRANLILAGLLDGVQGVGFLPGGAAQFLRVQTFDKATGLPVPNDKTWQTRAVFEVLMGANSYGYADGTAADWFYDGGRAVAVRVVLHELGFGDRLTYQAGDLSVVTAESVIGLINPFEYPNLADGWAVIGDRTLNPMPDFFGIQSNRIVIVPTGIEGPQGPMGYDAYEVALGAGFVGDVDEWLDTLQGPQGEAGPVAEVGPVSTVPGPQGAQGPRGLRGPIGPAGSGGVASGAPVIAPGAAQPSDAFMIVRALTVTRLETDTANVYMPTAYRVAGGANTPAGEAEALQAFGLVDWSAYDPNVSQVVDGGGPSATVPDWVWLVNQATGALLARCIPADGAVFAGTGWLISAWSLGGLNHPDFGSRVVAGIVSNGGVPYDLTTADDDVDLLDYIQLRGAASAGNTLFQNGFDSMANPVVGFARWSGEPGGGF